jgi:hypothetical protein
LTSRPPEISRPSSAPTCGLAAGKRRHSSLKAQKTPFSNTSSLNCRSTFFDRAGASVTFMRLVSAPSL